VQRTNLLSPSVALLPVFKTAYVRIRFGYFGRHIRAGKSGDGLARLISVCGSGQKPSTYPAK
jgi:hypothetical protein